MARAAEGFSERVGFVTAARATVFVALLAVADLVVELRGGIVLAEVPVVEAVTKVAPALEAGSAPEVAPDLLFDVWPVASRMSPKTSMSARRPPMLPPPMSRSFFQKGLFGFSGAG